MEGGGPRFIDLLMIVDDNEVDQMMCARIAKRTGLVGDVLPMVYAEDALAYLRDPGHTYVDVILLDINMPKMNGFEFVEAAQKEFGTDFAPVVVMLTTSLDPSDQERARQLPLIKHYLKKPLTIESLIETISEL